MAEHTTPRRNQINKMSPTEVAILSTIRVVENLGADVRLTDAVVLLQAARESVADFLDGVDSRRYVSNPPLPAPVPPVVPVAAAGGAMSDTMNVQRIRERYLDGTPHHDDVRDLLAVVDRLTDAIKKTAASEVRG